MSHRTNATATEGRPSAEGREVFPEEVAVSGDLESGLECLGLITGRGRVTQRGRGTPGMGSGVRALVGTRPRGAQVST